jgi:hypothetical protein
LYPDDRFLADVEVTKAADLGEPILLPGALFESTDEQHSLEQIFQRLVRVGHAISLFY